MATLKGTTISTTYPSLLHLEGNTVGLSGALQTVQDGSGNNSVLKLSTTEVSTSNITVTGGSISGITDLAITDGGTGASSAAGARTNLGLVIGTDVQAYDADLKAIADLAVPAGDRILFYDVSSGNYAHLELGTNLSISGTTVNAADANLADADYGDITVSGSGTVFTIDSDVISTFGRTLTVTANAAAARTVLGLTIGTDVQAYDAELAALAGLTSAVDKVPYFTGSGTAAVADFSSFGRSLVDDADAAAARTTLGLGTLATQSGTFSGTSSGINTGDQNLFSTIAVSGQSDVVADSTADTLTLVAGSNITITTNAGSDTITISSSAAGLSDADYGDVTVSGGGTVMTIDNDAVTYAKMQNVSATDKILGRSSSGAGNVEEIDCTAAGRALLDDVSASAQRTTLGLAIGTDVQAYDAELAALAGLTSAADKVPYFTGAGTAATADFSSFGRSLVDDADAATARTTLGLGTLATQSGTFSGTSSGTNTGDQNLFSTIVVSGQSDVVADSTADTLTLVAGSNITITTNAGSDTITISSSGGGGLSDADYGDITVSGSGTVMTIDSNVISTFGRTLTDDADAATARATLGLTIGTHVQAYDTELAALAGLTSAADALPYFTGAGTASTTTLTAAARALLDDATVAAMATTLGLGTGDSPQFTAVNVGHASDTTIARVSAGVISVEGKTVYQQDGTDVVVADGGTGVSSLTAYAVMCGGTTSTGAVQSVASVGTAGEVLTSNGPGALPTFQAATGGSFSIGLAWPIMNNLVSA